MNKFIPVCTPLLIGNEKKYLMDAIESNWISSAGKYVDLFERQFAKFCGVKFGVSTCNGTSALHLALTAAGIRGGDEVILPTFTMIASAFSVCYCGAKPVFVDVNSKNWTIDVNKIEEKISDKTKAIMPVNIYGHPADLLTIRKLCNKYNILMIEDAAEGHGADINGIPCSQYSDISCFSFFSNKNITTGEGGMVVTNEHHLYELCRYFKNLCFPLQGPREFKHEDIGFNYRMSNLHAAIGLAQTERAAEYIAMRINNGEMYRKFLSKVPGISFQEDSPGYKNTYWMNAVVINKEEYGHDRDELIAYLNESNVDTRKLFIGMHRQPSLIKYGCKFDDEYLVCDMLSHNGLYLPSSSSLTKEEIFDICKLISGFRN